MKKIIALFLGLIIAVSCNDILDLEPYGDRTSGDFYASETDLFDAIVGVYRSLQSTGMARDDLYWDNQSDDHWRAGDHAPDEDIETFNTATFNSKVAVTYQAKYDVISKATDVLIGAPRVKANSVVSDQTYNTIVGEAHFLRAYAYYRLLIIHEEVQIIDEDNVLNGEYNVPKSSYNEVSDFIISDLEKAAELLPLRSESSRVNKGSAWALLNFVYMDRARDYANTEFLTKAITSGQNVIDNYSLADDYHSLFLPGNEKVEEILFVLMNDVPWMGNLSRMPAARGPRPWGAFGFHEPLDDLVNEFEPNDVRKRVTVISNGESILQGSKGLVVHTPNLSNTGNSYVKFMFWNANGSYDRTLDVPLLRAAYTYLMVAEAKIRLNGPGAGDDLINMIRERAGLDPISGGTIEDLMHETRVETAGENLRHQNLLRWDKAGIVDLEEFYGRPEKMFHEDIGRRIFRRPMNYYQPLPLTAIDNSGGVLVQHPEWD